MLLPSKSDIQKKKADERQIEIQEGMKLAKRVDGLRERTSAEEVRLQKYSKESLEKILADIADANGILSGVLGQIDARKQELTELMRPIEHEYKLLGDKKSELLEFETSLEKREADWNDRNQNTTRQIQALDADRKVVDREKERWSTNADRAKKASDDAVKKLSEAEKTKLQADRLLDSVTKDLIAREIAVAARERVVEIKQDQINSDRRELNERETFINDKYETLERAEKENA